MSEALYRLVYFSRSDIMAPDEDVAREIDGILERSRHNNETIGVTGALMFDERCFAQVLEGPHAAIQETFERIQCDERHRDVTVLSFDTRAERGFGNWSMAYIGGGTDQQARFSHISQDSDFDPRALDGDVLYETLLANMLEAEALG
ncbi:BLUF domain-containing protein [Salinisphaera sp. SPP-AMP-43]|uniref:BLUF domain-containing protein n=1 Tax=Salinisphaera sp. SPP-AMP-43 TaxID=3121288 RepID=UPI003C6E8C36